MPYLSSNPAPEAVHQPQAPHDAVRDAFADWQENVLAHHAPEPAPDQAALTARVLANERAMFGRQITRVR